MGRRASIQARLRALPPDRVLVALALALAVTHVLEAATVDDPGPRRLAVAFAVLLAVPLPFAWRFPLGALLAFDAIALVEGALGGRLFTTTAPARCSSSPTSSCSRCAPTCGRSPSGPP